MPPKANRNASTGHLRPHSRSSSATKLAPNLHFTHQKRPNQHPKPKPGFTVDKHADDDDEWVSSESGAATPNHHDSDSDSDTASEPDTSPLPQRQHPPINRADTVKAADFSATNKRQSRPPSTHSLSSTTRTDHALRPHPLIRGASYGRLDPAPKPPPLAPLTVIPNSALPKLSTSPPSSIASCNPYHLSTSPTSMHSSSDSPISDRQTPSAADRRASMSSAKSGASAIPHFLRDPPSASSAGTGGTSTPRTPYDRARTVSMLSTASSAAMSSLSHLPSVTRPPSPQTVVFFPQVNPHSNIEAIHPLLLSPYLNNHLTVLARRNPVKDSFDRVTRARYSR